MIKALKKLIYEGSRIIPGHLSSPCIFQNFGNTFSNICCSLYSIKIHCSFFSGSPIDHRPLSPASLAKCEDLLMRLARFYKYHGINIKTCYADFDKHHIGVVTESQVSKMVFEFFLGARKSFLQIDFKHFTSL